ncbi:MAG: leucine-rich repeat domain-containing protein, partial [Treponema sp.]|nr:leucine-rich repeat domain-containing protein [Treponema sp.]
DNESLVIAGYTGRSTTVVIAAEYEGLPVRAIGESAFEEAGITAITLPNGVTFIGERAFEGCESLTSITLPNSVTSIGYGAFEGCGSLTSIALPNGVTDIGERAFRDCGSLETVTISPAKGRIWRGGAFGACPKLSPASKAALRAAGYKYNL